MFTSRFPNKFRSAVALPKGINPIWPIVSMLWVFTLGMSLFFMDDIYLFSLSLEQHPHPLVQSTGRTVSGWIEQNPKIQNLAQIKNTLSAPVEDFYERELRFGTRSITVEHPTTDAIHSQPTPIQESPKEIETMETVESVEHGTPLPKKVLMMGGSSMKTALGSLLQSHFREHGVESIREAQIGTGLARADVVDWVQKANNIMDVHSDIELLIVQFIGNDCQTIVNSQHEILAKYGTDAWNDVYLERWDTLYQSAKSHNVNMVIVGLPIMKSTRFDRKVQTVSDKVFEWAENNQIPVIAIRDLTTNGDGSYEQYLTVNQIPTKMRLKDGVHLSYQGSKIISRYIFEELRTLFDWTIVDQEVENTIQ